jgi:predicted Zn-dependent protease
VARRGPLIGWAFAAVASVALIIFVLVPTMANQLARFIPPEGERALGEVTLNQIRSALDQTGLNPVPVCDNPEGLAALAKMESRLQDALPEMQTLTVSVLDHEMINAFALPGNYIVFFRGLIEKAQTPEEVAAVFAHEIGHVVSRDPTRHALRSAGSLGVLGLIFGDFAGGAVVLLLAERLIEAQYSQDAESQADAFAHAVLLDARIAPSALATMFDRFRTLGGDAGSFVAHFLSHPSLGDRIQAARDATPTGFEAVPVLSAQEWRALQNICD